MFIALYLLYRIAFPKHTDTKKDDNIPEKQINPACNVMGESRFVLHDSSHSTQTSATIRETEEVIEKANIFASETEKQRSAVISADELDRVFDDNPEIMSIPLDGNSDENEVDFDIEEIEELNRATGQKADFAEGFDYDELQTVAKAVKEQSETVSEQAGRTIVALEHTDIFELLADNDEGTINWIKKIIDRHVQTTMPEMEDKEINTDYGDFEIADFLS